MVLLMPDNIMCFNKKSNLLDVTNKIVLLQLLLSLAINGRKQAFEQVATPQETRTILKQKKMEAHLKQIFQKKLMHLSNHKNYAQGCLQKKTIAQKVTLEHTGGRGVKKSPFLASSKRGHIFMEGSKYFCHMSHIHFCFSVSTKFHHLHNHLQG